MLSLLKSDAASSQSEDLSKDLHLLVGKQQENGSALLPSAAVNCTADEISVQDTRPPDIIQRHTVSGEDDHMIPADELVLENGARYTVYNGRSRSEDMFYKVSTLRNVRGSSGRSRFSGRLAPDGSAESRKVSEKLIQSNLI